MSTSDQLVTLYAGNLAATITETRPRPDELEQLLLTELTRLLGEERSHWYGIRCNNPHGTPGTETDTAQTRKPTRSL